MSSRAARVSRVLAITAVTAVLTTALAGPLAAADDVARYSALAQGTGHAGFAAGKATKVEFVVNRWTTSEERQALIDVIATNDGNKITQYMDKLPVIGTMHQPGQLARNLTYAWKFEQNGKATIMLGANRPLVTADVKQRVASADYFVGVARLEFDGSKTGTGDIAPAIQFHYADGHLTTKNSAADPVTLTKIWDDTDKKKKKK